jgi:hypothetical protein
MEGKMRKVKALDLKASRLSISCADGSYFTFELNQDQLLLLIKQAVEAVWFGYLLVPRD